MITKEALLEVFEAHEAELKASVLTEIQGSIKRDIQWQLQQEIGVIVKKFMAEDIAPEIRAALVESKPAILTAVAESAAAIGEAVALALVEDVKKNLSERYKRSKILQAMIE